MFKRKSKYSVSYTGVDHVPLPAQEPDRGATAAARTIGENMKKAQPHLYGPPQEEQRTASAQAPRSSSLLKRNSSLLRQKPPSSPQRASSLSAKSNTKQNQGHIGHSHNHGPEIIGESTRLSSLNASNEARIRDLKLKHQPQNVTKEAPVKMIKKYIPTPNGIQVVEVPESSFKQELARSNSMRSGLTVRSGLLSRAPRSPSLNSKSAKPPPRRGPGLRLSSFTNEPSIAEEPDVLETREETIQRLKDSAFLKSEIEKEKKRARDLEQQRLEYEQLESLRAHNEKMSKELEHLRERDLETAKHKDFSKQTYSSDSTNSVSPVKESLDSSVPTSKLDYPVILDQAEDGDDEEEVPIVPVPHAVDEVDLKHAKQAGAVANRDSFVDSSYTLDDVSSQDNPTITSALEVLETYEDHNDAEVHNGVPNTDDFGIEEVAVEQFDSPKLNSTKFEAAVENSEKTILPTFDPVPEVIGESGLTTHHAGSIRSISSLDSKSKPMKSAMKKPGVAKVTSVKQTAVSPAEQAYLSLTTAENTRLNSKISALQLNGGLEPQPTVKSPPPSGTSTPQKRISQTLRKQPSMSSPGGNGGGMANRTIRPRRHSDIPTKGTDIDTSTRSGGGGMSARNFRTDPKPIAPHPALSPNYQSPSKQKAAALYEKANSRPISHFEPTLRRKSSFSRESEQTEQIYHEPAPKPHMKSLRSPGPKPANTQSMNQFPLAGVEHNPPPVKASPQIVQGPKPHLPTFISTQATYKLKIVDSDDEAETDFVRSTKPSRFVDSDDEGPPPPRETRQPTLRDAQVRPLRDTKSSKKEKEAPKEEKKKKKRLLKKLFGIH